MIFSDYIDWFCSSKLLNMAKKSVEQQVVDLYFVFTTFKSRNSLYNRNKFIRSHRSNRQTIHIIHSNIRLVYRFFMAITIDFNQHFD
jgi:hypothetical protein